MVAMKYKIAINRMATGKLPQGDSRWATFNDSFENTEADVMDVTEAIYAGKAYTTWHRGRRKLENFQAAQHIAIDMDTGDERSSMGALLANPIVRMYAGIIHTTPSHTPQAPRARVIFFLDQPITSADAYRTAATFLIAQFPGADTACTDASRFFYGNKGADIWFEYNELPLAHLRTWYGRWLRTQPKQRGASGKIIRLDAARAARIIETTHGEDAPAVDDIEKVKQALARIDPWGIDYNQWIGVIAALKRDLGDGALSIAEQWAQGKPGEVQREWARINTDRSNGMHLGTIFYMARG